MTWWVEYMLKAISRASPYFSLQIRFCISFVLCLFNFIIAFSHILYPVVFVVQAVFCGLSALWICEVKGNWQNQSAVDICITCRGKSIKVVYIRRDKEIQGMSQWVVHLGFFYCFMGNGNNRQLDSLLCLLTYPLFITSLMAWRAYVLLLFHSRSFWRKKVLIKNFFSFHLVFVVYFTFNVSWHVTIVIHRNPIFFMTVTRAEKRFEYIISCVYSK